MKYSVIKALLKRSSKYGRSLQKKVEAGDMPEMIARGKNRPRMPEEMHRVTTIHKGLSRRIGKEKAGRLMKARQKLDRKKGKNW